MFLRIRRHESTWDFFLWQVIVVGMIFVGIILLVWGVFTKRIESDLLVGLGIFVLIVSVVLQIFSFDPNRIRAQQTDAMLLLANDILACIRDGVGYESAQKVCELLLPSTAAAAVAITDTKEILGYAGYRQDLNPPGYPIATQATHAAMQGGNLRIMFSSEERGFPDGIPGIQAGVIVPLTRGDETVGTVKFYFKKTRFITETQLSIAENFGLLLSAQIAAASLEKERKASARMRLKMLQSQINPHFLFNTINTVSSFVRTDPEKARFLLREIAAFFRGSLSDSSDLITFSREMSQTERYFRIEEARFGANRILLVKDIDPRIEALMIPPFIVQPLVENAVRHALPSEGLLTVRVEGRVTDSGVIVQVIDDGRGMSEQTLKQVMHPQSAEGLGMALKNVNERICGSFEEGTCMKLESTLDEGTKVSLVLCCHLPE